MILIFLLYTFVICLYIFSKDAALHRGLQPDPRRPNKEGDSTLELGELEQLCVNNDAEISYDVSSEFYSYSAVVIKFGTILLVIYVSNIVVLFNRWFPPQKKPSGKHGTRNIRYDRILMLLGHLSSIPQIQSSSPRAMIIH